MSWGERMDDITNYFKDFLDDEDLASFLKPRIFSRDLLLDDPVDFINGFNLALAYAYKNQMKNHQDEANFRISLALWLRSFVDDTEKLDWR